MIPLAIPDLSGNESDYLLECIQSTFVSSVGPFVTKFEDMVAKASGSLQAVATSAGTTGLHAALTAVGVGKDNLVVLPAFTFIGSANSISHCGAEPWLMDIDLSSLTLNPVQLEFALKKYTKESALGRIHVPSGKKVSAIMPVHVLGIPADMDPIVQISKKFGLPVVADGAAALGASYKNKLIGAVGSDLTVFSFNGNKTVTAGGGGAVSGNDEKLLDLVRHLTTTARISPDYDHDRVGFNYRLTNIQAAVGCAQLERLEKFVAAKRKIQKIYNENLLNIQGVSAIPEPEYGQSASWFSGIILDTDQFGSLKGIREKLRELNVDARPFWKPIHKQVPYANVPKEDLSNTDKIWDRVLTLPCSTSLTEEDQNIVIKAVRKVLS
ncbi:DegT/DnrJ/EryC1/StrS family aminotransferase [Leptospira santarosai]|uniref:DegT/DnrJ/EryC1/StrS family aminotransferase n=1 Tax=Leptospira santarosai TaxID=28183 RepID=UPI0022A8F7D2|nr:DegT/DnrJ/EryC1/StrS family aminotransferase [Leptospira santarosai]MDI7184872.1 DegT/DnrJ/EryC1/StrS family aminotransferase [Leptospira santarosai]MDI7201657.1 DegT/DnrJ/EryC1/StrS family aminotransferase [Leptospira santarosai]MDI7237473.1 DegT/DnrJ/EryC1/StrS family aminotransferase [Leptospira santarosai]UZN08541.1 DegT/DnrJ/EryC1/StrS family aminotransferase [Leptospira santarosai]